MTSDDIEELDRDTGGADLADPTADVRAMLRRIASEAIGRLHADRSLRLFGALEIRALLRGLADHATSDGEAGHAGIFTALAATISDEGWGAAADWFVVSEINAFDEAQVAAAAECERTPVTEEAAVACPMLIDLAVALNEAGLLRAEALARRWRATAERMKNGGEEMRAALIGIGADTLAAFGSPEPPASGPFDASHTLARVNEIVDDAVARFELVAANTMMTAGELRAWLLELGASARRGGRPARATILEALAGTMEADCGVVDLAQARKRLAPAPPAAADDDDPPEPPPAAA